MCLVLLEPIADCAYVLAVIDDALEHLDELTKEITHGIQADRDCTPWVISELEWVDFSYGEGKERRYRCSIMWIWKFRSIQLQQSCPSEVKIHDLQSDCPVLWCRQGKCSCGSMMWASFVRLLSNISMVFQNVYLFHTVRNNILLWKTERNRSGNVEAAKKRRHDFIMAYWKHILSSVKGWEPVRWRKNTHFHRKSDSKRCTDYYTWRSDSQCRSGNEHLIQAAISNYGKENHSTPTQTVI